MCISVHVIASLLNHRIPKHDLLIQIINMVFAPVDVIF